MDPVSVYMNGLRYVCDRDPQTTEPTLDINFLIANFSAPSYNKIEWLNNVTGAMSVLTNIDSSNNLYWSYYNLTPISSNQ
jgi:hypothetical protein